MSYMLYASTFECKNELLYTNKEENSSFFHTIGIEKWQALFQTRDDKLILKYGIQRVLWFYPDSESNRD